MPPRKVKRVNELNQVICYNCPVVLDDTNCAKGRYSCKICRKEQAIVNLKNKKKTVTEKHCNGCDTTKLASEFNKDKSKSDNLETNCRECGRERNMVYLNTKQGFLKGLFN
jgi:MinD superfamily P-loop ATPase